MLLSDSDSRVMMDAVDLLLSMVNCGICKYI